MVEIWKFGPGTVTVMLLERFEPVAVKKLVPVLGVPWVAVRPVTELVFTVIDGAVEAGGVTEAQVVPILNSSRVPAGDPFAPRRRNPLIPVRSFVALVTTSVALGAAPDPKSVEEGLIQSLTTSLLTPGLNS